MTATAQRCCETPMWSFVPAPQQCRCTLPCMHCNSAQFELPLNVSSAPQLTESLLETESEALLDPKSGKLCTSSCTGAQPAYRSILHSPSKGLDLKGEQFGLVTWPGRQKKVSSSYAWTEVPGRVHSSTNNARPPNDKRERSQTHGSRWQILPQDWQVLQLHLCLQVRDEAMLDSSCPRPRSGRAGNSDVFLQCLVKASRLPSCMFGNNFCSNDGH